MLGSRQYLIKDTATCKLSTEEVGHSCQLKYQGSNSYLKKQISLAYFWQRPVVWAQTFIKGPLLVNNDFQHGGRECLNKKSRELEQQSHTRSPLVELH